MLCEGVCVHAMLCRGISEGACAISWYVQMCEGVGGSMCAPNRNLTGDEGHTMPKDDVPCTTSPSPTMNLNECG